MTEEQLIRAGHYVLGLLEGADLTAFEAEMSADPALRSAVERLRANFICLDDTATPAPASPALWDRIAQSLDQSPAQPTQPRPAPARPALAPNWLAMAASVVVALGIGFLAGNLGTSQPQPIMVAVLINEADATPGAIVEAFADDSVRLLPLEQFAVPEGQILQVWTLPDVATGPVSLGTFSDPQSIHLSGPDLPLPHAGQLYEITLEPAPGSPTGKPTGPILVKGYAKAPAI